VIVLVWSFITEARLNRMVKEEAELLESAELSQRDAYPIPVLAGAVPPGPAAVESKEVLDV
jgi:hypothetical protein